MNNPIIELKDLTKCYGSKTAVDKLNLAINQGEIFGLLGPNGAGKTTTILMMLGLTEPSSGTVKVCGHNSTTNPLDVKKLVGYLPDNVGFYPDMTPLENLCLIGELNGLSASESRNTAKDLLYSVGLQNEVNKKTGAFSRGMKQRLGLAEVLIKKPKVAILDEPTLGIDPSGINDFLEMIQRLSKEQNLTVLMSSHHLHQVQRICDRVGIFVSGKMLVEGEIESLANKLQSNNGYTTVIQLANSIENKDYYHNILKSIEYYKCIEIEGKKLIISSERDITAQAVKFLVYNDSSIVSVSRNEYTLDDIYMKYFEGNVN